MAKKRIDNADNLIINQIIMQRIVRHPVDVQDFMNALMTAESPYNPIRKQLYDIFHKLMLDAYLQGILQKRYRNIKNIKIRYVEHGRDTTEINRDYFEGPWFTHLIHHVMESIMWGHSLIEFVMKDGYVNKVNLIDRYNVRQNLGIVTLNNYAENTGIEYRNPPYSNYTLEVEHISKYGLLMYAAINTLLKMAGKSDFADFVEMFGSPIREYRYDPRQAGAKAEAEKAAKLAGNSSAIILPDGMANLILHDAKSTGSQNVHTGFLAEMKSELAILILGQNMTSENGSSRSQAEVHEREQQQVTQEDMIFVHHVLNWDLKEKLIALGYPISMRGGFEFDQTEKIPILDQLKIDIALNGVIDIPPAYFYEKYGIPTPTASAQTKQPDTKPSEPITKEASPKYLRSLDDIIEQVILQFWQGNGDRLDSAVFANILASLTEALIQGYGASLETLDADSPDYDMLRLLQENINVFAAHKTWGFTGELQSLADAMRSGEQLATFTEFRTRALQIHKQYNVDWLRSEYNTAIASAQSARKWLDIERDKETLPLLRWQAILDPNTRDSHAALNGVTLPIDDEFWQAYYPPIAWNCRCIVQQLSADNVQVPAPTSDLPDVPKALLHNAGRDKKVFNENHDYFNVSSEDKEKINNFLN